MNATHTASRGKPPNVQTRQTMPADGDHPVDDPATIRPAATGDADGIWSVFAAVVRPGDTYAFPPDIGREQALAIWLATGVETFVAENNGRLTGTYILKPNQMGPGDHVANCAYMVHPEARRLGIGRQMAEHSLERARARGFRAMQYNLVVSTNTGAIRLWQRLGFAIVGTLPAAFRHPGHGDVDAYIMYRRL